MSAMPDSRNIRDMSREFPFGRGSTLAGYGVIATFLGGLLAWALLAPIESAVVAPGVVSVEGSVKTVQHLEGGIVDAILVDEGDTVRAGDMLVRLRATASASALNEVYAQYVEALATEARLIAERDGRPVIGVPAELRIKAADAAVAAAIAGQQSIFDSRRGLLREQQAILARTKSGLQDEIAGLEGQISASERQIELIAEELTSAVALLEKGLTDKPRVLELRRRNAELEGTISNFRASIAGARQRSEEARLRQAELRATTASEVVEQLRAARSTAYEMSQKLAAAQDVLSRTEIRSPIDGVIVGLRVHTIGGVIAAGEPLLDIVPSNGALVIQASIDPLDIDQVKVGLRARVRLAALDRRDQAMIDGELVTVSADRLTDPATGLAFYLARVALRPDAAGAAPVHLQPGMSAEVMIRTGARTPWDYLSAPIARYLGRSLREE